MSCLNEAGWDIGFSVLTFEIHWDICSASKTHHFGTLLLLSSLHPTIRKETKTTAVFITILWKIQHATILLRRHKFWVCHACCPNTVIGYSMVCLVFLLYFHLTPCIFWVHTAYESEVNTGSRAKISGKYMITYLTMMGTSTNTSQTANSAICGS